nr:PREDICTED: disco-interacting protein 2 homolog A-like isoform X3 [Equus przewalskii]
MADRECPLEAVPLPAEVRESLAELELELSEGDITQKGYEKKRAKLLARYIPLIQDVHTEAVQAALAKYKERKMPMPSKRRSVLVHSSVETYTPPDTSSASEDEGSLRRPGRLASTSLQSHSNVEPWLDRVIQGSSTSSSASSPSSPPGGRPAATLAGSAAHAHIADLHSAPPDVTTGLVEHSHCERPQLASVRGVPRGYSGSILETAGGEHASLFFKQQSTGSLLRY